MRAVSQFNGEVEFPGQDFYGHALRSPGLGQWFSGVAVRSGTISKAYLVAWVAARGRPVVDSMFESSSDGSLLPPVRACI